MAADAGAPVGIRLEGVSAQFRHRVKGLVYAARDVTLAIAPGELLTLLGPSGCGKTTTLRMIAGFQEPSAGRILIGERDVTRVMASDRDIGFVFQSYALFPHLSIFENVAYGLRVRKEAAAGIARRVGAVLDLVGLAGYERQLPSQLSGGEQQRVALARAIVIRPRVLLFDEPLSNLDAKLRVQMRSEIRELQKRLGITAVYVTHDQEEAMAISDRIAVMSRGEIVQLGDAETLYRRPASTFVAEFIGRSNLLAATVESVAPGAVGVSVAGARLLLEAPGDGLGQGMAVRLVVRPEAVTLAAERPGALAATVRGRTYLGEKVEYELETAGGRLQAVIFDPPEGGTFPPGCRVAVQLPTRGLQILPETAS
ncbi:MAG: ABC transporter ATP-binding protein [Alphaproteobacteria bacterium]|nr:ABC transporter ATP-binding protein [Alphaproteobacteria bacterium]